MSVRQREHSTWREGALHLKVFRGHDGVRHRLSYESDRMSQFSKSGRHFLQIPGPTAVPDRIQRAMAQPVIDHRGPDFADMALQALSGAQSIFKTDSPVLLYPSSGSGMWESALVNTLSAGDRVLMVETGHFATLWAKLAARLGVDVELIEGDWRSPADPNEIEDRLRADTDGRIKAVCVVHNETSTGVASRIDWVRAAIDAVGHPALLMVDTISSLASMDYEHDSWGVDVTVGGSQKGLMLPPGLGLIAVSERAMAATASASLPRAYWRWDDMIAQNEKGYFPYTPPTALLFGLNEAIAMLHEEGLDAVFARHARHGEAVRAAVAGWGLDILCADKTHASNTVTAVMMPAGVDADFFRSLVLDRFDMSLGTGLGKVAGKVFRIGHLGHINDLTLIGALAGVEMGLQATGMGAAKGGVSLAMDQLGVPIRA